MDIAIITIEFGVVLGTSCVTCDSETKHQRRVAERNASLLASLRQARSDLAHDVASGRYWGNGITFGMGILGIALDRAIAELSGDGEI